jgi:hypothetical protein
MRPPPPGVPTPQRVPTAIWLGLANAAAIMGLLLLMAWAVLS